MPYYNSDGIRIFYLEKGQGTPLVFLHGFTLDHSVWQEQLDYFSKKYRVIVTDARGHGQSDAPKTAYAREDRAQDILNLANQLNIDKFHLAGHSMGGGDALNFAIDNQERLKSLILIGTVASGWQPPKRYRDFTEMARKKGIEEAKEIYINSILIYYDKRYPELKERLRNIMLRFSGMPWLDPMKGKYKKRNDIELANNLKVPVFLIVGQHDIYFKSLAETLHEKIENSTLEIIPDAGHMVNLEKPNEFNSAFDQFLNKITSK